MSVEFDEWLAKRPKWLQTAASNYILTKKLPDASQTEALADLCEAEAAKSQSATFVSVQAGAFGSNSKEPRLLLSKIHEVVGVNAIRKGATLDLRSGHLVVVYGENGTGKSGYARLLKHACGARAKEDIHGDVFSSESLEASAKFNIDCGGTSETTLTWSNATGALAELRNVHCFDSRTAGQYVVEESEATYEPARMRFVSALIAISEKVAEVLRTRKFAKTSSMPAIPAALIGTDSASWLEKIKSEKKARAEENDRCKFSDEEEKERQLLELALAEKEIPARLKTISNERDALKKLKMWLQTLEVAFSPARIVSIVDARKNARQRREAATTSAQMLFASSPLPGVGEATWKMLWEQAERYSKIAYPELDFPNTAAGAVCILCQQDLTSVASDRLRGFREYVAAGLEKEATLAEEALEVLEKQLPELPNEDAWKLQVFALFPDETQAISLRASAAATLERMRTSESESDVPSFQSSNAIVQLNDRELALAKEDESLRAAQAADTRLKQEARLRNLNGLKWLTENQSSVKTEIGRLDAIDLIAGAEKLTSTNALTTMNIELSKEELNAGYQKRFSYELGALGGGRLRVQPSAKSKGKGKVTFGIQLKNPAKNLQAHKILSEGESRIVSLAAFLADMTGQDQSTPFVFDDPISSLDMEFEERVVNRLAKLATSRQVIIFTHRLSFLAMLDEAASKVNKQLSKPQGSSALKFEVVHLFRLGDESGIVSSSRVRDQNPKAAANQLLNEAFKQLQKTKAAGQVSEYESAIFSMCTDFRIILEKCVEETLLQGVIKRARRSVATKDKIGGLAKITKADCELIDELMTEYSGFEHSQPDELPTGPPDFDKFRNDVQRLSDWIKEFEKRV